MMATAAVIGLSAGKRLLNSSSFYSDITVRLYYVGDHGFSHCQSCSTKTVIVFKNSSNSSSSFSESSRNIQSIKALKDHVGTATVPSTEDMWYQSSNELEDETSDFDSSVEDLLLLQKAMLEKQWNLLFESTAIAESPREKTRRKIPVSCSGISARQRRINSRRKTSNQNKSLLQPNGRKQLKSIISPELLPSLSMGGYVKGVISEKLLPHAEVVRLSKIIRIGISLEEWKSRLKERLGTEPTDEQLATSMRISRFELQSNLMECSLAREKLAMSNVRLVLSIAQRYENMGTEMGDLVQGGLIGLLRGIEKFDSSKGFKISTYVYWWIRQGVSRALIDNSRTLRLPTHLHERLGLIRNAKIKLQEKGITPSIDRIAETLKISQKKVRNATEAVSKVFSLDRDAFPSLNGLPGETHHSYIADNRLENNPWHGVDEWLLKDEVNKLINSTLEERERDIIRLYYGLDNECLTWEDISKRIGLSRERVRQVGLVAVEKLKNAARKRNMEAMLMNRQQ